MGKPVRISVLEWGESERSVLNTLVVLYLLEIQVERSNGH